MDFFTKTDRWKMRLSDYVHLTDVPDEAEHNIKVNTVAPGLVDTEVGVKALTEDGSTYGKNDRGHATKGMSAEDAAKMIMNAIRKDKRETYIIPMFSISKKQAIFLFLVIPPIIELGGAEWTIFSRFAQSMLAPLTLTGKTYTLHRLPCS